MRDLRNRGSGEQKTRNRADFRENGGFFVFFEVEALENEFSGPGGRFSPKRGVFDPNRGPRMATGNHQFSIKSAPAFLAVARSCDRGGFSINRRFWTPKPMVLPPKPPNRGFAGPGPKKHEIGVWELRKRVFERF